MITEQMGENQQFLKTNWINCNISVGWWWMHVYVSVCSKTKPMNQICMDRERESTTNKLKRWEKRKSSRKEEREGEIPPLRLGLKLIGPGLEKIIYEKKNTENLYKALHSCGFHGDSRLCNSATATGRENKTSCCLDEQRDTNQSYKTRHQDALTLPVALLLFYYHL